MALPHIPNSHLDLREHGDVVIAEFRTRMLNDDENLEEIGKYFLSLVDDFGCRKLIVSLEGVGLVSSFFMGKLITLHRKMRQVEGTLVVCGFNDPIAEVMRTSKLDVYLNTTKDVASALESFGLQDSSAETLGLFVVIEGIDGSGKGTQAQRLATRLESTGKSVKLLSFPRYDDTLFGQVIGDFLNGRFGQLDEVDPYLAALLYAGDRFESRSLVVDAVKTHDIVVCDRYVPSNVAHQAAKLAGERCAALMRWIGRIEHDVFALPRPDLVLLLDLPVSVAQTLIAAKQPRSYTDRKADLQEADSEYLERVREVYQTLADSNSHWITVDCMKDGELQNVAAVGDSIWRIVGARCSLEPSHAADSRSEHGEASSIESVRDSGSVGEPAE